MNKNMKIALIMLVVFFPMVGFILLVGAGFLLALPVILFAGLLSILASEGLYRIAKKKRRKPPKCHTQQEEELHRIRKISWFWANVLLVMGGVAFHWEWLAWASLITIPYLSRNCLDTWRKRKTKEADLRDLIREYRRAYNANNNHFALAMFIKLFLGADLMIRGLKGLLTHVGSRLFLEAAVLVIGGALLRSFYREVKEFSVEAIDYGEDSDDPMDMGPGKSPENIKV